ncbi:MAG: hypothetical protein ACFE7A_05595, partial [Promethearchaeota archaeon]
EGVTISKSAKWWSAALLIEAYGKRHVALYLWNKNTEGTWKRKQKILDLENKIVQGLQELPSS